MFIYGLGTMLTVSLLLLAEGLGIPGLIWVLKPLASAGFLAAALSCGARRTPYGRWILAALVCSWLGDVLLISETQSFFLAGLLAFLCGHLGYATAFWVRGISLSAALASLGALIPLAYLVGSWLLPKVPPNLQTPVLSYMIVITSMVALAVGTWKARGNRLIVLAAVSFFASDLSVAYQFFVQKYFPNRLWGLPLYYAAQLLFAFTVRAEHENRVSAR